ncbi:hypothetical protein, partial [Dokdonella sp.]|uniref:hypothetical protein n=1 Tax=Dokdonella sp. TaxID=2291710 RepID=UPI003BB1F845
LTGLGGIARRGIYDNMKTAVDRVPGRGKARIVNARFTAMTAHCVFRSSRATIPEDAGPPFRFMPGR